MPVFSLVPKHAEAELRMRALRHELRSAFKQLISSKISWSEDDVLVDLLACPYIDADPASADLRVIVQTCPHEQLEKLSDEICDEIAQLLINTGFSVGKGAEGWIQFLPGPWRQVLDGKVIDSVNHPRKKEELEDDSPGRPDDKVYADRDYFPP